MHLMCVHDTVVNLLHTSSYLQETYEVDDATVPLCRQEAEAQRGECPVPDPQIAL